MSLNSFTSSSSRSFLIGFVSITSVLMILGTALSFYLGSPGADILRIGQLARIDWEPAYIQAPMQRLANPPITGKADILVLGDSFSIGNIWQSELFRQTGKTSLTWHYADIGCIDNWLKNAIADNRPEASKIIIIETIEREFFTRFTHPKDDCRPAVFRAERKVSAQFVQDRESPPLFPIDLRYTLAAARNHFSTAMHHGRQKSRSAVSVDLTTEKLFSNSQSARLSYFHGDDRKWDDWSADHQQAAVDYLAQMTAAAQHAGKRLIVLIVPDKSSTYAPWVIKGQLPPRPQPDLFQVLAERLGAQSNYLPAFQHQAGNSIDFFRPDDTHLGLDGFRFLAHEIQKRIQP